MQEIGLADVRAAAQRIAGRVLRTPSLPSDALSRATGAKVTLKLETLQATGAFKERGAANRLALLSEAERERAEKQAALERERLAREDAFKARDEAARERAENERLHALLRSLGRDAAVDGVGGEPVE